MWNRRQERKKRWKELEKFGWLTTSAKNNHRGYCNNWYSRIGSNYKRWKSGCDTVDSARFWGGYPFARMITTVAPPATVDLDSMFSQGSNLTGMACGAYCFASFKPSALLQPTRNAQKNEAIERHELSFQENMPQKLNRFQQNWRNKVPQIIPWDCVLDYWLRDNLVTPIKKL